jgi:hypothetical protein
VTRFIIGNDGFLRAAALLDPDGDMSSEQSGGISFEFDDVPGPLDRVAAGIPI